LLVDVDREIRRFYGTRLISLVVYGSVGRGNPGPDSDVDLLVVADPLPHGRIARVDEFHSVKKSLACRLQKLAGLGIHTYLSPVFKTPAEVHMGSLLFLDMIDDGRVLFDRAGFWADFLEVFKARLQKLGARKIRDGDRWYWDLKPDYRPGEVFEI
jgi:hypothetical protein